MQEFSELFSVPGNRKIGYRPKRVWRWVGGEGKKEIEGQKIWLPADQTDVEGG